MVSNVGFYFFDCSTMKSIFPGIEISYKQCFIKWYNINHDTLKVWILTTIVLLKELNSIYLYHHSFWNNMSWDLYPWVLLKTLIATTSTNVWKIIDLFFFGFQFEEPRGKRAGQQGAARSHRIPKLLSVSRWQQNCHKQRRHDLVNKKKDWVYF